MNILGDIAVWLASSSTGYSMIGPGVASSMPVYQSKMPASTGNFYVIYQYGGMAPDPISDGYIDNPRIQVKTVTSASSDNGYLAALTAQNRLRYVSRTIPTSTGTLLISCIPLQSPESLGADENGRMHWIQNFQLSISY